MKRLLLAALLVASSAHAQRGEPPDPNIRRPIFADSFEGETPRPVGPAPGFHVYQFTWEWVFFGAKWPNGISTNVPIGSYTMRTGFSTQRYGLPAAGRVITVPFEADSQNHRISWAGAQGIGQVGYLTPQRALFTSVTISEHRADMYSPCQASSPSALLFYGPTVALPECRTVVGRTYWLTVHHVPPDFSPAGNSCLHRNPSGGVRCDGNFNAR